MEILNAACLGRLEIKNRLVRSATWEGLCDGQGEMPDALFDIYKELADGGVGLIITGLTDVCPYDIGIEGNMRLVSDGVIPEYKKLTDEVHKRGGRILCQLNINNYTRRSGEQVSESKMTEEDIALTVKYFVEGAKRSYKAGFDGVQLHLAYGWLLNRFLDPNKNHRTDAYGGSTENRCRIVTEIVSEVRRELPDYHVCAKFSFPRNGDGFDTEVGSETAVLLSKCLDSIELLGDGSHLESDKYEDGIYLDLVVPIMSELACPVILTGNNRDMNEMEKMHAEYGIAAFGLCRALIREPDLPKKFLDGSATRSLCRACGGCNGTVGSRCVFNVKNPDI